MVGLPVVRHTTSDLLGKTRAHQEIIQMANSLIQVIQKSSSFPGPQEKSDANRFLDITRVYACTLTSDKDGGLHRASAIHFDGLGKVEGDFTTFFVFKIQVTITITITITLIYMFDMCVILVTRMDMSMQLV